MICLAYIFICRLENDFKFINGQNTGYPPGFLSICYRNVSLLASAVILLWNGLNLPKETPIWSSLIPIFVTRSKPSKRVCSGFLCQDEENVLPAVFTGVQRE